ncbi:MAG: type III pantothenate kinase [SAR202 cluster bacterium]|nr:type III pantothenate kinase [SAR202 cluster bacterium]|tara:strand:+ start:923 stop:1696 length:774 start_codon:yes stop_codon:yes gene_type:complete
MLLAIDIGNTNITIGLFNKETLEKTWRISTSRNNTSDEYGTNILNILSNKDISNKDISAIVMCSVVPPLTTTFVDLFKDYFNISPLIIGSGTKTGIKIMYDSPRDVGADRIVDAAAVLHLYKGPAIIVDLGTATVFDAITANGEYLGGAISPGIGVSAESLYKATSQLKRVELIAPKTAIGKTTTHAIQSGLILGYSELIKGMIKRFKEELDNNAKIIATGGLADIISKEVNLFDIIDHDLTLKGLQILYKLNSTQE